MQNQVEADHQERVRRDRIDKRNRLGWSQTFAATWIGCPLEAIRDIEQTSGSKWPDVAAKYDAVLDENLRFHTSPYNQQIAAANKEVDQAEEYHTMSQILLENARAKLRVKHAEFKTAELIVETHETHAAHSAAKLETALRRREELLAHFSQRRAN